MLSTRLRKEKAAMVLVTIGNLYQSGFPDLYVAHRDWTGWLELKYQDGRSRKSQQFAVRELRRRGVPAYFFRQRVDELTNEKTYSLENEDHSWKQEFGSIDEAWEWLKESVK